MTDPTWMPAHELRDAFVRRAVSPVEVTRFFLDRIARLDGSLRSFITVDHEGALDAARRAEFALFDGEPLGPLHGVPISIKDTIATRGLRSTFGSVVYVDHVPMEDAIVVERLRAAGAVILGKTNTPEFAFSGRTVNRLGTECVTPWDVRRTAGGSSGGAGASTAAGFAPVAIGTDAGGSIRYPAAFNGVFGILPSAGLVPKRGAREADKFGMAFSAIGPLTRDVRDAAVVVQVLAGHDPRDQTTSAYPVPNLVADLEHGVRGLRIGWIGAPPEAMRMPGAEEAIHDSAMVFENLGAHVDELHCELPDSLSIAGPIRLAAAGMARRLAADPHTTNLLTPYVKALADMPSPSPAQERDARAGRLRAITALDSIFAGFDLLATPTACYPAPECPADPWAMYDDFACFLRRATLVNVVGMTAASIPCGFSNGLPLGLHLIAPRRREARLLRACRAFETARPWSSSHPTFVT